MVIGALWSQEFSIPRYTNFGCSGPRPRYTNYGGNWRFVVAQKFGHQGYTNFRPKSARSGHRQMSAKLARSGRPEIWSPEIHQFSAKIGAFWSPAAHDTPSLGYSSVSG